MLGDPTPAWKLQRAHSEKARAGGAVITDGLPASRRAVRSSVSFMLLDQDSTLPTAGTAVPSGGSGAKATSMHGERWAERKPGSPTASHPRSMQGLWLGCSLGGVTAVLTPCWKGGNS